MRRAALLVLLSSACADDPGPLDRSTIAEIARSRGDAQGGERTGIYAASLEIGECDCPDEVGYSLCLSQDLAEALGVTLDVVEGDGFMVARTDALPQVSLSGAIDADGAATLGSVHISFDVDAELAILGRLDGTFSEDGDLTGHASVRAQGKFADSPISCGFEIEIDGTRL